MFDASRGHGALDPRIDQLALCGELNVESIGKLSTMMVRTYLL